VVDADNDIIYVADSSEVLSIPIGGGAQTSVSSSNIFGSGGLTMDANGDLLVTVGSSAVGRVLRVDPSDGSTVQISNGGLLKGPRGIVVYSVPEPASLWSGLTALGALVGLALMRQSASSGPLEGRAPGLQL